MGYEGFGVKLSFGYELQGFFAVTAVNSARSEGEVFTVHLGKGQGLRLIIESDNRHRGIGTCALPGKAEGGVGTCYLENNIRTAVCSELIYP